MPNLSLTLVNQQAGPCRLFFSGSSAYWNNIPSIIRTNETFGGITCYPRAEGWNVNADLVITQDDARVWQLGFWCDATESRNTVISAQLGYGAITVLLAPWNSWGNPLEVTATIIQTG
jgi:hypothetical protein